MTINLKQARLKLELEFKPNPPISRNEFQTLLAIAALSDNDGVCRSTRELINEMRIKPVRRMGTITDHVKQLVLQPWFSVSQVKRGSRTQNQYTIKGAVSGSFGPFPLLKSLQNHASLLPATLARHGGFESKTTPGVIEPEIRQQDGGYGPKPDGLPAVRPRVGPGGEKREKLFELLASNIVPLFTRLHFNELLEQYHELKIWSAWNYASKYGKENAQVLTGFFWLHLTDMLSNEIVLSNLQKQYSKRSKPNPRSASNQAGANKPPKSGRKSQETAQISSQGMSDNDSRQADQEEGFMIYDVY